MGVPAMRLLLRSLGVTFPPKSLPTGALLDVGLNFSLELACEFFAERAACPGHCRRMASETITRLVERFVSPNVVIWGGLPNICLGRMVTTGSSVGLVGFRFGTSRRVPSFDTEPAAWVLSYLDFVILLLYHILCILSLSLTTNGLGLSPGSGAQLLCFHIHPKTGTISPL